MSAATPSNLDLVYKYKIRSASAISNIHTFYEEHPTLPDLQPRLHDQYSRYRAPTREEKKPESSEKVRTLKIATLIKIDKGTFTQVCESSWTLSNGCCDPKSLCYQNMPLVADSSSLS